MTALDYNSTQAISKFLRTSADINQISNVMTSLLNDPDCVLPNKEIFILELIANRLSSDANVSSRINDNKKQKRTHVSFYNSVEIWKIVKFLLTNEHSISNQGLSLIKSIKYLELFNLILIKQDTHLLNEFVDVFSIILSKNFLKLSNNLNKNNYYLQMFLTITNNYLSMNDTLSSGSNILFELFNYMKYNSSINVNFNNPELLAKNYKIKDLVKFSKDNSQFLIQFFISNNLLDKLLSLNYTTNSISNKNFQQFSNELIILFIENSIIFEFDNSSKINFSTLIKHFNFFIQDDDEMDHSVSSESALELYKIILINVVNNSKKFPHDDNSLNETLVSNLIKFKNIKIETLLQLNIENFHSPELSSEYLMSFYNSELSEKNSKIATITKTELTSLSSNEIKKLGNKLNFELLDKLVSLDCLRNINNNDSSNKDENRSNLSKFAYEVLCITFHCNSIYFNSMITKLINHYSQQAYSLIYLLESYKELLFVPVTDVTNTEELDCIRAASDLLLKKLSLLSISQLDDQVFSCIRQLEKLCNDGSSWSYLNFLLKYLFLTYRSPKFVNNSNHRNVIVEILSKLTNNISSESESYYKSIYLILNILNSEIPEFMMKFISDLTYKIDMKNHKKSKKIGFYQISLIFKTLENATAYQNSQNLNDLFNKILSMKSESNDKFDFLNLLFIRYFNILTLVDDSKIVNDLVTQFLDLSIKKKEDEQSNLLITLRNPLLFENSKISSSIIKFLRKNINYKNLANLHILQEILLTIPVECYDRNSKIEILDNQIINSKCFNVQVFQYLLSVNPTYNSKIESDLDILFSNDFVLKTNERLISLLINNHIRRLSQDNDNNSNEVSRNYLLTLIERLRKVFRENNSKPKAINHLGDSILITDIIFKNIENFYSLNEEFQELKSNYCDFLISYLKDNPVNDDNNNNYNKNIQSLILKSLGRMPVSFFKNYNIDLKNKIIGNLFNQFQSISSMDLKISIFAILPLLKHFHNDNIGDGNDNFSKFCAFYVDLFISLSNINGIDDKNNSKLLNSCMCQYLDSLSEENFCLLYSFLLTKIQDQLVIIDIGTIYLFECFFICLKNKKSDFENINWKKLLVDTCSYFLCIDYNELQSATKFLQIMKKIIDIFAFIITDVSFLISQYSFELILSLIYKISSFYKFLDLEAYESLMRFISRILLVYRFRLAGRYHLLVEIYKMLLLKLTTDSGTSIKKLNIKKLELVELTNSFTRSIGNLVQPNDQSAKTLTKKKSTLVSNVNLIKKDLRKHLPNLVLFYIKTSLDTSFVFESQIKNLLQNNFIFLIFDVLSDEEFNIINSTLDSSGRSYYKTIYENYNKFGKWKSD